MEYPDDDPDWFNNQDILYWDEIRRWSTPPDGSLVAGSSWLQGFSITYDSTNGELIKIINSFSDFPHFSPNGDLIGYDYPDHLLVYSNMLNGEVTPTYSFESGPVFDIYFSQDDQIFTLSENEIKLFSFPEGELTSTYPIDGLDYYWEDSFFAISNDDRVAVIASHDNVVFWNLENETSVLEFTTGYGRVTSLTFSSDGRYLAVGTDQGILHLYGIKP